LGLLLDGESGRVPNLGPNDSAYILPLTVCAHNDYRPALQAASLAWRGAPCIEPGPWDEMVRWLVDEQAVAGNRAPDPDPERRTDLALTPHVIRLKNHPSWIYLRAAHFFGRPGHADQLHLDLWWRGLNLAQDPGTYLYNVPPPWDNALTCTQVHNTLSVNGQEQMQRAGRFLYLRRAQAHVLARQKDEHGTWQRLEAQHDGYLRLGVIHRRTVTGYEQGRWLVEDRLLPFQSSVTGAASAFIEACLHWLLPDWDWQVDKGAGGETTLQLRSPHGPVRLVFSLGAGGHPASDPPCLHLTRAGERVYGSGDASPIWGWSSPSYGDKIPALAVRWTVLSSLPVILCSEWILP
jgi:hypothetical protein